MLVVRRRTDRDLQALEQLAARVRAADDYPTFLPGDDYHRFLTRPVALGAWVSEWNERICGHVALNAQSSPGAMRVLRDAGIVGSVGAVLGRSGRHPLGHSCSAAMAARSGQPEWFDADAAGDMTVHLTTIDRCNWREALQVQVHPDQLHFVADHQPVALVILAKSYLRPGDIDWVPHAIVDANDTMVGLVALAHHGSTCEIHHLVIDAPLQGQGLGRGAVGAIIDQLRQRAPTCRTLTLTVHPDNHRAQRLYMSTGFAPTGAVRHDEPVWSRNIASPSDDDTSS